MVLDGLRGYLQIASGLTDVTRQRALAVARSLAEQGEAGLGAVVPADVRDQVAAITEELLQTGRANRDLLLAVVRSEVERQVGRLGLVSADELESATARADRLERRLRQLETERETEAVPSGAGTAASGRTAKARAGAAVKKAGAGAGAGAAVKKAGAGAGAGAAVKKVAPGARARTAGKKTPGARGTTAERATAQGTAAGVAGEESATGGARPSVSRARSTRARGRQETRTT